MEFTIKSGSPEKQRSACVVVGVFDNRKLSLSAELIDRASNGYISEIIRRGDMEGKLGATLLLHNVRGTLADRVLLVGLGKERDFRDKEFRQAIRSAVKLLNETGSYEAVIYLTEEKVKRREVAWRVEHAVVVAMDAVYRFEQMKSEPTEVRRPLRKLTLSVPQRSDLTAGEAAAARGLAIAHGMDLAQRPRQPAGQRLHAALSRPSARRSSARSFPTSRSRCSSGPQIEALGMGSFLSVTNGSDEPPRFIVLEYDQAAQEAEAAGAGRQGHHVRHRRHLDQAGRRHGPDEIRHVRRGVGARRVPRDRRAQGEAQRRRAHSDVREHAVRARDQAGRHRQVSMSGQTIEVLNTDAEGRLILADALTYAERYEPEAVVDIATLTGAMVVALGHVASGIFSNSDTLARALIARRRRRVRPRLADAAVGRLPGRAGQQFRRFRERRRPRRRQHHGGVLPVALRASKYDWAHLDIAGIAWKEGKDKGATGRPGAAARDVAARATKRSCEQRRLLTAVVLQAPADDADRFLHACRATARSWRRRSSPRRIGCTAACAC